MSYLFPQPKKPHSEVDGSNPNINIALDILENAIPDMPNVEETGKPIHDALAKTVMKRNVTNSQKSLTSDSEILDIFGVPVQMVLVLEVF